MKKFGLIAALALLASPACGEQLPDIPSNFDVNEWLHPVPPDTSNVAAPGSSAEGAFRFVCNHAKFGMFDPIVSPGQDKVGHWHEFYGNMDMNPSSTYESLRSSGHGTCHGGPINRSAYWHPAMMDGQGNFIKMSGASIYYKAPVVGTAAAVTSLPRGLRFITGFNMGDINGVHPNKANWGILTNNVWKTATPLPKSISEALSTMTEPLQPTTLDPTRPSWSPFSVDTSLLMQLSSPNCWDGVNLDSPNHRSHVSFKIRDASTNWVAKCPPGWVEIPQFTIGPRWQIFHGDDVSKWHIASDHHAQTLPGGSAHADWFGGWDFEIMERWIQHCLREVRSSVEGNLCDGQNLKRAPEYRTWFLAAGESRVPIPIDGTPEPEPPPVQPPEPPPTPPTVRFDTPAPGTAYGGNARIEIASMAMHASGIKTTTISLNGAVLARCATTPPCTTSARAKDLREGGNSLSAVAVNNLGLSETATITIIGK